jgi:phosphatidylserine decarboxylase
MGGAAGKMKREKCEIWIYRDGRYEKEPICADRWMRLIYENPVGSATLPFLLKRKAVSRLYGMYCRTPMSARGIPRFIDQYNVDMTGFGGTYKNYAEFFTREKKDVTFPAEPHVLGSPCEGLVSAYTDIDPDKLIAAKGSFFTLSELFGDSALAREYQGGSMLRIRLTPANYHRIHFFDDGVISSSKFINGSLNSVSPLAVRRVARLYCRNKRAVISFSSVNFGETVMVEVGATCVGGIVHCFENGESVGRGRQTSYFKPGGSLLLIFFKNGMFSPGASLLEQTAGGYETKIMIGEELGVNTRGLS